MKLFLFLAASLLLAGFAVAANRSTPVAPAAPQRTAQAKVAPAPLTGEIARIEKPDAQWKQLLSAESYRVLRHEGTEMAFTGAYWNEHRKGVYRCAGCELELFRSTDKFESGTGWPSYTQPFTKNRVQIVSDTAYGMSRDEVECARCGGHLGHVFSDGPAPTGLRYCINSASLAFAAAK